MDPWSTNAANEAVQELNYITYALQELNHLTYALQDMSRILLELCELRKVDETLQNMNANLAEINSSLKTLSKTCVED